MTWMRAWALGALAAACLPGVAHAHLKLLRSEPADGARVAAAPAAITLVFNEPIELAFTRLTLEGPAGPVQLSAPRRLPDNPAVAVARVAALSPGAYVLRWQAAGADGHPIRGAISFTVEAGAIQAGPPPAPREAGPVEAGPFAEGPGAEAPPQEHHPAGASEEFDADSAAFVLVRWVTYAALLGIIGAVAFRLLVLGSLTRGGLADTGLRDVAARRAAKIGAAAAAILLLAALARLYAQSYAVHGPDGALNPRLLASMLGGTLWGWGWLLQLAGTATALWAFRLARRADSPRGWAIAAVTSLALAFVPALSGHAVAAPRLQALAVLADATHVVGAFGWLGTLFLLLAAGVPAALSGEPALRHPGVAKLVNAFSPIALTFAGAALASGVFAAWLHVGSFAALWTSAYGRTLLLKLAVLSLVAATGFYNWRKVRPGLGDATGTRRIGRSAWAELAVAAVVLAVTAVLVALPTPTAPSGH